MRINRRMQRMTFLISTYIHLLLISTNNRDLATRNILLKTLSDGSMQCLITDMGLARLYNREETYQKTKAATAPLKVSIFLGCQHFTNTCLSFIFSNIGVHLNYCKIVNSVSKVTFGHLELFVLKFSHVLLIHSTSCHPFRYEQLK
jgi:hypothetical protein